MCFDVGSALNVNLLAVINFHKLFANINCCWHWLRINHTKFFQDISCLDWLSHPYLSSFMPFDDLHSQEVMQLSHVCGGMVVGGGRVGLVIRALAFHQCGPGSISALGVICGLSLLVLYSAMRGFPPGTPVFPSHQKPNIWFDLWIMIVKIMIWAMLIWFPLEL